MKLLNILFFFLTVLNAHELYVDTKDVTAKLVQIRFSDGTPFKFEKCELFFFEHEEYKSLQVLYTNAHGEFSFFPKKLGKYKIQCFRADGHGVQKEIEITKITKNQQQEENVRFDYYAKYILAFLFVIVLVLLLVKFKNKSFPSELIFFLIAFSNLHSHHGIASLGSVEIRGPGAGVETSTQGVLPENQWLYLMKLDSVQFKTFTPERDEEMAENQFYLFGVGYGIFSYLSLYFFLPYNQKTLENQSYNTSGFADFSFYLVLGFKYDETFYFNPKQENLDDLQDYHFSIYLGTTIPTSLPNIKNSKGDIDPGMSLGFGKPAITLGGAISKFYDRITWNLEFLYLKFKSYKYQNNIVAKFGDEFRTNLAFIYRVYFNESSQLRFDSFIEINYLKIFPDKQQGISNKDRLIFIANQNQFYLNDEIVNDNIVFSTLPPWQYQAIIEEIFFTSKIPESNLVDIIFSSLGIATEPTGGEIYYITPGFRMYYKNMSFALGVKLPVHFIPNTLDLAIPVVKELMEAQLLERELDLASVLWKYKVLEENLYQGSEGKELYRFILSLSFLF